MTQPAPKSEAARRFGERIKKARAAAGFSQRKLALLADYDQVSLSRAENGEITPRLGTIMRIAQALGLDVDSLIGSSELDLAALANNSGSNGHELGQVWKAISITQQSIHQIHATVQEHREAMLRIDRRLDAIEQLIRTVAAALELPKDPHR